MAVDPKAPAQAGGAVCCLRSLPCWQPAVPAAPRNTLEPSELYVQAPNAQDFKGAEVFGVTDA